MHAMDCETPSECKALWDYVPVEENELALKQGEKIKILYKHNQHWWEGVNDQGKYGLFPANHVHQEMNSESEEHDDISLSAMSLKSSEMKEDVENIKRSQRVSSFDEEKEGEEEREEVEEGEKPLPMPWKRSSNSSGDVYYYNALTKMISWQFPQEREKEEENDNSMILVAQPEEQGKTSPKPLLDDVGSESFQKKPLPVLPPRPSLKDTNKTGVLIIKQGYLARKNIKQEGSLKLPTLSRQHWKTYWVILKPKTIEFFKEFKAGKPDEILDLNEDITIHSQSEGSKKLFVFHLCGSKTMDILLQAQTEEDKEIWMKLIRERSRQTKKSSSSSPDKEDSKFVDDEEVDKNDKSNSSKNVIWRWAGRGEDSMVKIKTKLATWLTLRPPAEILKKKGILYDDAVFGGELTLQIENEKTDVPKIVKSCIAEIERRGLECVGLYRLTGNTATVQKLKEAFNTDHSGVDLSQPPWCNEDINAIASTFKLYFRELKIPLTTFDLYDQFIHAVQIQDYDDRMLALKGTVNMLPEGYYRTLKYLIYHLTKVADLCQINKMECSNLAIVFGPTLMRPREGGGDMSAVLNMAYQNSVIESMISQYEWMFDQ